MNNNELELLLEKIKNNVSDNKYDQTHILYLSELLQKFNFVVEMNSSSNTSKRDMINFLSLGWYIYNNVIETN
tara:strand:- start:1048 stop:1266 length:219 start_codon:yes stop_codon:yes gene_type:complete